jgi:cephalosporin hydroxylase
VTEKPDSKTPKDDRAAFAARAREQSIALGQDDAVFQQSLGALLAADKYQYPYLWSWMGVPIIQLPADVMATQEVIFAARPDVIVETGVARGGSVIFMASLLELIGKGKVVGVDIDIRAPNRATIESHHMAKRIVLIEGPSADAVTVEKVRAEIPDGAAVMVVLDSDHSYEHVLAELRAYGPLVTQGQFLVAADTLLGRIEPDVTPQSRSKVLVRGDEPNAAVQAYLRECGRFEIDAAINGKLIFSSSPGGYLRCIEP